MISNNEQIRNRQFYKHLFSRSAAELDEIIDHAIEFRRKSNKVRKSSMREALTSDPFSRDGGKKLECITESFVRSDGSIYVLASVPVTNTSEADCSSDLSEEASFRPVLRKHLCEGVHYDPNYVRSHTSGRDKNQSLHRKWTEFDVSQDSPFWNPAAYSTFLSGRRSEELGPNAHHEALLERHFQHRDERARGLAGGGQGSHPSPSRLRRRMGVRESAQVEGHLHQSRR